MNDLFLDPVVLRKRLQTAALYITGYEQLKSTIIDRTKEFHIKDLDESDPKVCSNYADRVLSRNRNPLSASLSWLEDQEVINVQDRLLFKAIKERRTALAHDLPSFVLKSNDHEFADLFDGLLHLLQKIETWWMINVEIPSDAAHGGVEISESDFLPAAVLTMKMTRDIALGHDDEVDDYIASIHVDHPDD